MSDLAGYSLGLVVVLVVLLAIIRLRHVSMSSLVMGATAAIVGLLLGALVSVPVSHLPGVAGNWGPLVATVALTILAMAVVSSRQNQILASIPWLKAMRSGASTNETQPAADHVAHSITGTLPRILVDTSAIIDGRIADIATAGFVPGKLVVTRFVLAELQNIADSEDAMRRGRGRRGLEVLGRLRDLPGVGIEVIEDDVPGIKEVDAKLVALAQRFKCHVLTTDYNLNQVAGIQGVRVLNVNELSNAIRPVVLPGEELRVRIVQPGKERNQGVGYLADGTMIVVENGDKLMGQEVRSEVTRVFQTVAGKMIFAAPIGKPDYNKSASASQSDSKTPSVTMSAEDSLLDSIAAASETSSAPSAGAGTDTPKSNGASNGHRHRGNRPRGRGV